MIENLIKYVRGKGISQIINPPLYLTEAHLQQATITTGLICIAINIYSVVNGFCKLKLK